MERPAVTDWRHAFSIQPQGVTFTGRTASLADRASGPERRREIGAAGLESQPYILVEGREIDGDERQIVARHPALLEVYAQTDVGQYVGADALAELPRTTETIDIEHQVCRQLGNRMG